MRARFRPDAATRATLPLHQRENEFARAATCLPCRRMSRVRVAALPSKCAIFSLSGGSRCPSSEGAIVADCARARWHGSCFAGSVATCWCPEEHDEHATWRLLRMGPAGAVPLMPALGACTRCSAAGIHREQGMGDAARLAMMGRRSGATSRRCNGHSRAFNALVVVARRMDGRIPRRFRTSRRFSLSEKVNQMNRTVSLR